MIRTVALPLLVASAIALQGCTDTSGMPTVPPPPPKGSIKPRPSAGPLPGGFMKNKKRAGPPTSSNAL